MLPPGPIEVRLHERPQRHECAPANWYQDPQDAQQMRYWDGQAWTGHLAPNRAQILPVPPSPQAPSVSASSTVLPAKVVNPEDGPAKVPLFGARAFARQQADELLRLRNEMNRLGILDVAELERQRIQLKANVAAEQETFRGREGSDRARTGGPDATISDN
jgi:hypothetical protein